jgi:hypothetical protein
MSTTIYLLVPFNRGDYLTVQVNSWAKWPIFQLVIKSGGKMPKHHRSEPISKSKNNLNIQGTTVISKASDNPNRPTGTPAAKRNIT